MRIPFFNKKFSYDIKYIAPVDFNDEEGRELILERRKILLPILKKKWLAEAREIEKQYLKLLTESIPINISIERRVMDYDMQLKELAKTKPSAFVEKMTTEIKAKLEELHFIKSELEKERLKK